MPTFVYNSESNTRSFDFQNATFHYLTIMLSNCSYNGSVFVYLIEEVEQAIEASFKNITNLEFRGVGCSMVRGNTDSLTLGVAAGYYSNEADLTSTEALSLRTAATEAITSVSGLTVSEVRVESTLKQLSSF